jgi:hypothetical protein
VSVIAISAIEVVWVICAWPRKIIGVMMNLGVLMVWIGGDEWKNEIAKAVYIFSLFYLAVAFKESSNESILLIVLKPLLLVSGQDL